MNQGDELQSALRAPEPDAPAGQQPVLPLHRPVAPGTQLFEGLEAAAGATVAGPRSGGGQPLWRNPQQQPQQPYTYAAPAPPQQQQPTGVAAALFEGLDHLGSTVAAPALPGPGRQPGAAPGIVVQQTVSEAQRQVDELLGGLADSPFKEELPLPTALLGGLHQPPPQPEQQQQQQVAEEEGEAALQQAVAPRRTAEDEAIAAAAVVAAASAPQQEAEKQTEAAFNKEQAVGADTAQRGMSEEEGQPEDGQTVQLPPQQHQQDVEGEEEQWADAAAVALPGSQGDDDFQDAAEELLVTAQGLPVATEGIDPW